MKPEKEFVEYLLGHITYPDNWEFLRDTFKKALTSTESYEELFTDGELIEYITNAYDIEDLYGLGEVEKCFLENFDIMEYVDVSCYSPGEIFGDEVMHEYAMETYFEEFRDLVYDEVMENVEGFVGTDVMEDWAEENGWVKKDV